MILVEKHIINKSNKEFKALDQLCFLSKNLYNSVLYTVKKHYEETGKTLRYNELEKLFKTSNQKDYRALPNNSSQQIMMLMDKNIKSFFSLIKKFKNNKKDLSGCPKFPKYKDKIKGRNVVVFTSTQVRINKKGLINFPKITKIETLRTKLLPEQLKQVRIIPQTSCYVIEVVYEIPDVELLINDNKASIDLGINNLASITFNNTKDSYIFNGKPLKSINQFYNKKLAGLKSNLPYETKEVYNKKTETKELKKVQKGFSNKTRALTSKRNNKVNDYMHKSSKKIVDLLVKENISQLVVGYNKEWKQDVNLKSKTNQNFCSIPYYKFIEQLRYKCQLNGILFLTHEESYTSKCSALDLEPLGYKKDGEYLGKRIKRGLFQTQEKLLINADINGSLNIGRKVFGDEYIKYYQTNRGQGYWPIRVNSNEFIGSRLKGLGCI